MNVAGLLPQLTTSSDAKPSRGPAVGRHNRKRQPPPLLKVHPETDMLALIAAHPKQLEALLHEAGVASMTGEELRIVRLAIRALAAHAAETA